MNIDEARGKIAEASREIGTILQELLDETGLNFESISARSIRHTSYGTAGQASKNLITGVTIDLKL